MLTVNGAAVEVDDRRPGIMADVAAAVTRRSGAVSQDVYEVILREVPQLRDDKPVLALLASSVTMSPETKPAPFCATHTDSFSFK